MLKWLARAGERATETEKERNGKEKARYAKPLIKGRPKCSKKSEIKNEADSAGSEDSGDGGCTGC